VKRVAIHLLALWVALCCCQWRAIGSVLGMPALPSCCAGGPGADASPCDDDRLCADDRPCAEDACCAAPACCDEVPADDRPPDPSDGRCAGCCDKAPAASEADPLAGAFDLFVDGLGTMLLCGIVEPGSNPASALGAGTVWHPPPGRLRPLLCILTV
jgi:hypothetical protein